ncbi:retrovirus-related pol polyprotein from transposon TNT 1-94 [Tanacetum coccineum]|uniref:Retrovirus-related pol polyprotein from transposon TNT 1-94 n=1 Tax=Tanacetum coccineum TaxID=301880 RepID=A0ABQ5HUV9_9ASTR
MCDSCEKCMNLDAELSKSKQAYNDLLKNHSQLEKHCISLEVSMQLKQEVFQNDESCVNQNAVEIQEYFKINDLKARLQDKDTTISKLKDTIKSLKKNTKEKNVHHEKCDLEPINEELENKNEDLKAQIQDKVFVITSLKNNLRKSKGKEIVENVIHIPSATTITPGMFKLDLVPLPLRLLQNREVHINYLRNTQEQANILRGIVEQVKVKQPLDGNLDLACKYATRIQELLVYVQDTYAITPSTKKVTVTPMNNVKKVRLAEPLTSSSNIKQSLSNANSDILCATCNKSMFDGVHDICLLDLVRNGNNHAKSAKKHKNKNIWKPTGHVFTKVGFKWKPTGRTFTIIGNSCPLTRFTSTNVVPPKKTTSHSDDIQKPELKVYSRKPKNVKNIGLSKKAKIVESMNANHSEPNKTWGSNATDISSSSSLIMTGTVRFGNDQIARIMGYGDYQLGNVIISRVYYVEGLGHNLFFVGQFCDADLEVAFQKNTCFIHNLEGVDLLSGSRDTNLYIISLNDMLKSSPICLLSKASKTKSWLWHRRLSHLNFGTLNKLAKDGLARGIPRLKFQKDHLCSTCALVKSKKSSHQSKAEDSNQEKLYLLHMDLFLKTKDEAPAAIIKCIKNIQVRLKAAVQNVRTDNGTEFVNQTLHEWYENVGITHQTSVARTPQQNDFMQDKKPDLSFFHVFCSLCYPTNDHEDLGKFDSKADIGIFVGYAPTKKAFRIYNRRTWIITETLHVTFDELTAMASEQFNSGPELQCMISATSST